MEENIDNIELLKNSNETIKEETDLVQEIETKPKSNSLIKFFLFLILALFFTILGGLAVWYMGKSSKEEIKTELSPTPIASSENKVDEMDGWNTYLNEEYGFEFKYNPSWNIDIFDDSNITINNIKDNHKLRILIEQVTGFNYCFKYEETSQINIGNVIAETADGVGNSSELCDDPEKYLNLGNTFILIPIDKSIHSPKQILISYEYPLSDISFAKVNLDRILSTFKFMDMEDERELVLETAKKYLDAYVIGDWDEAKKYGEIPTSDFDIEDGSNLYNFVRYEINEIEKKEIMGDPNYYDVYVTFYDKDGVVYNKTPHDGGNLVELMHKDDNGQWKALTWYFYE